MAKGRKGSHTGVPADDAMAMHQAGTDTLPKFLLQAHRRYGDTRIAMRRKDLGIWNPYSWAECYQHVKDFALGLVSLGLEAGDRVCIVGDNEPEWYWAEIATQAVGGTTVGIFVDVSPTEVEFFVSHSESKFALAGDQEQVDKFLQIREKVPKLAKVIFWDPKGMWGYRDNPFVIDFKDVEELGEKYETQHPSLFEQSIEKGKGGDTAIFCYTSGTTGALPKGAMLSHDMLIKGAVRNFGFSPTYEGDEMLSYMPGAWIGEQVLGIVPWLIYGTVVNFVEKPETVMENMKEIGPKTLLLGSRQWENLLSMVQVKINDSGFLRASIYNLCLPIGYRVADFGFKEQAKTPQFWKILDKIAEWLCFRPIRDQLGVQHARTAISGGALIGPETFRYFLAIGIKLKSAYGLTEIQGVSGHIDVVRPDSVGIPLGDTTIRISDEGEVLAKNVPIFEGYYGAPEATAAVVENGWVRTGDAGFIDHEGHLIILGRLKEMLELKGGGSYSCAYIENSLKFSPYVRDAMIVGGEDRDYIVAIVNIDFETVGKWAEKNRIPYTTYVDLSQKSEVYDLIMRDMERVNKSLPANARVKRYSLLYKEFDADEGELTRTRKLRRGFMEDRYRQLIEAAYNSEHEILAETEVKYRDGRIGKVTTSVNIKTVE